MQTGSEVTSPVVGLGTEHWGCMIEMDVADTVVGTAGADLGTRWVGIRAGRWMRRDLGSGRVQWWGHRRRDCWTDRAVDWHGHSCSRT